MKQSQLALAIATVLASQTTFSQDLEQILVTASRTAESGQDLALTWSAVDSEAINLTGHVHINELMQRVAGAWISRGNGQESLTALRSPVLTGSGSCGAFFMAWDGISLRAPGFCNVNQLFDVNSEQAARVEVIKGPATALYGSNAMHGVINVLSAAPTPEEDQRIALEAGPDDYYRARYHYRNTYGDHGISVSVNGATDGGYKNDSGYDQQKVTLRHDYNGDVWQVTNAFEASNLNQETAGFIRGFEAYKDDDLKDTNPNPEAYRDAWSALAYSRWSRDLAPNHRLTVTPYWRKNDMQFLQHFLPWQPTEDNGHQSLGLRATLHSDVGNTRFSYGTDFEYTDGWLKEFQERPFSPNQPQGLHYDYQVDAVTAAGFGQAEHSLSDRWTLSGGARYEYTEYDYNNRTEDGPACGPEATACRFFRPADRTDDFGDWNLNAGVSFALSDTTTVYGRVARGFRAPQTTELYRLQAGQEVADLNSEEIDNIEVGIRGGTDKLRYDLALFYMEKDEVIFQDADRQNVSGASTDHEGAEFSIDYQFSDAWYAGLDMTAARHRYTSRTNLIGSSGDIKGNDIDTAPRLFGSARLGWDLGSRGIPALAELEWVYMDEYYLEPDNEHEYEGHNLLNLRVRGNLTPRVQATLRVTNLLDEDYAERADFGFGSYRYFVGQPRGAYFELAYQFGAGS